MPCQGPNPTEMLRWELDIVTFAACAAFEHLERLTGVMESADIDEKALSWWETHKERDRQRAQREADGIAKEEEWSELRRQVAEVQRLIPGATVLDLEDIAESLRLKNRRRD